MRIGSITELGIAALAALMVASPSVVAAPSPIPGDDVEPPSILLLLSRDQDSLWPEAAFRLHLEIQLPGPPSVSAIVVTLGDGAVVALEWEEADGEWWVILGFTDLASLKATAHGEWTIQVVSARPSISSFTLGADRLVDGDFFACPQPLVPTEGATVGSGVICSWSAPASGPFPALYVNPWIDYFVGTEVQHAGPSGFFDGDASSWDPSGCLEPGFNTRLGVAYIVPIDSDLISPITVEFGSVDWETPVYAPPGYPAPAPLVALAGQTRTYFSVAGPTPMQADFNCDGSVDGDDLGTLLGDWGDCSLRGAECVTDLNHDGVVDGDDLGTLLGAWSI